MSHMQQSKLETQEMLEPTFRKAVELLASQHGMTVVEGATSVKDMAGHTTKVDMVLHHPDYSYDVGASLKDGKVVLSGDTWHGGRHNNHKGFKDLQDWVDNYYTAVVTGEAMVESGHYSEMNYSFDAQSKEIVIEGIKY